MNAIPLLPVDDNWQCHRTGDCCRLPERIVMTEQERDVIQSFALENFPLKKVSELRFFEHGDGFVSLQAKPCPLLGTVNGKPTCTVHAVRPYNCRRFACQRPDPSREPLRIVPLNPVIQYGNIEYSNLRIRLIQSRVARRLYALYQRKAQVWARKHGWKE